MFFEGRGDRLDPGEAGAHDAAVPCLEELGPVCGVGLRPKFEELFFIAPGLGGLQIDLQQLSKAGLLAFRHQAVQPQVAGAAERVVAFGLQARVRRGASDPPPR